MGLYKVSSEGLKIHLNEFRQSIQSHAIKAKSVLFLILLTVLSGCVLGDTLTKRENEATAYYKYGIAYLGDNPPAYLSAYIEFQKAIELDPRNRDVYYALGHVHFELKNYKQALDAFNKVLSFNPEDSEAHNYIGRVYAFQGKLELAIASYEAALKNTRYATPEIPYWNMGLVYIRLKKYRYAVQTLSNALRMKPELVPVHNLLGNVYAKMRQNEKAIAAYQAALRINPSDINAHYNLACIHERAGARSLADASFNRAVALSPELKNEADFRKCLNPID